MHPDHIFQNDRPDKVRRTVLPAASVAAADKVVLPLLEVVRGTVPHLCPAVGTVDHPGKQAALARFRPAVPLLPNLLHLVEHFLFDNRRVGIVENRPFIKRRFPLLLVPNGIGVGLEVDRTARVLPPLKNCLLYTSDAADE